MTVVMMLVLIKNLTRRMRNILSVYLSMVYDRHSFTERLVPHNPVHIFILWKELYLIRILLYRLQTVCLYFMVYRQLSFHI